MEIDLADKNILVTGATGFVGSHIVEDLVKQKANVVSVFQSANPRAYYFFSHSLDQRSIMANIDVTDFEKVFDLVTKFEIEYIFHLAAQPLVDVAYYNPKRTLYSNILGTINVLESARLYPKIKGVIVASSDKAYGKKEGPYREDDPLLGDHPYEASKAAADLIAQSYYKTYGLPVVITRFGNIYGEGDLNFSRIIPGAMKAIVRSETLKIRSDGKYVRDYLYVKDVVNGYLLLAQNIKEVKGEAFNFGSDESLSVLALVKKIQDLLKTKIEYKILDIAKNEIPYQSLDYSKINRKLGWKPQHSFSTTITQIKDWYQKVLTHE